MRTRSRAHTLLATLVLAIGVPSFEIVTEASFPGSNGRIVFVSSRDGNPEIYSMNPDGSDLRRLTTNPGSDDAPAVSADGATIAFASDRDGNFDIYAMNADGTAVHNVTAAFPAYSVNTNPAWSPDGTRLAFEHSDVGLPEVYVMGADGANPMNLTNDPGWDAAPAWSPDGTRIAFVHGPSNVFLREIYVMNADGSNPHDLTNTPTFLNVEPSWAPDGSRIAFARGVNAVSFDVFVMSADGSAQTQLTNISAVETNPAWSPDGQQIAFSAGFIGTNVDLFVMNTDGSNVLRITTDLAFDGRPDWSASPATGIEVQIDIKPGTVEDSINPNSNGVIPVAVLTDDTFDATKVDLGTIRFGGNGTQAAPVHAALEDVDGDGDTDLILHFRTRESGILCGTTSATLKGKTFDDHTLTGTDSVHSIPCK